MTHRCVCHFNVRLSKMAQAWAESNMEIYHTFFNSFHPDVKQLMWRLERINYYKGRIKVTFLIKYIYMCVCVCVCVCLCVCTFSFLSRGIILWIELSWPENTANTCTWHTETLDSCFDLINFHQQCIAWSPTLEIKPATIECRAETLLLTISLHRTQVTPNQLVMVIAG